MRFRLHALCALVITLALAGGAQAADQKQNVAFPPRNCAANNSLMAFDGPTNGNSTYCTNGQDVMKAAVGNCASGQVIAFNGSAFYCKADDSKPNCTTGQALTYTASGFQCITIQSGISVPSCPPPNFLTYDGTNFACSSSQPINVSSCPTGYYMAGIGGGQPSCAPLPQQATLAATCPTGQVLKSISDGQAQCVVAVSPNQTCGDGQVMQGINDNGTPRCVNVVTSVPAPVPLSASCPKSTQVIAGFYNGVPNCVDSIGNGSCAAGKIFMGIYQGQPICGDEPRCNNGYIMTGIHNGQPECTDSRCPAGQVIAGIYKDTVVCMNAGDTTPECPAGQAIVGLSNGVPVCKSVTAGLTVVKVDSDISSLVQTCPESPCPNGVPFAEATCPSGTILTGGACQSGASRYNAVIVGNTYRCWTGSSDPIQAHAVCLKVQ